MSIDRNSLPAREEGAISISQQRVLQYLAAHSDQWFSLHGTQHWKAARLVKLGLISRRTTVPNGRRLVQVRITSAGIAWLAERDLEPLG